MYMIYTNTPHSLISTNEQKMSVFDFVFRWIAKDLEEYNASNITVK